MTQNNNLNGALTGLAIAATASWARYDDETQRRLRNVRLDAEEAIALVRDAQSRGDAIRARLPTVQDIQVGIALATPAQTSASVVPSTAPLVRPDITPNMDVAVEDMTWPPKQGVYDDRGLIKESGELTTLALALTFEEVRAWVQGLVMARQPNANCKNQIWAAAHALTAQLCDQSLTYDQYKAAWARLFGSTAGNAHSNSSAHPSITFQMPGLAVLTARGSPEILGYQYPNKNTDQASKWRLIVGGGAIGAGTMLATIAFSTGYTRDGQAYEPSLVINPSYKLFIGSVNASAFSVFAAVGLAGNEQVDFNVLGEA